VKIGEEVVDLRGRAMITSVETIVVKLTSATSS
jgi:hypothetical protein